MLHNEFAQTPRTSYKLNYQEDIKLFNDIVKRYGDLKENDILGAFQLHKDALQCFNRWSEIKEQYKGMIQGDRTKMHEKERLEEMLRYLDKVHHSAKDIYSEGKYYYKSHKED